MKVIGLDIGTTTLSGVLIDFDGKRAASAITNANDAFVQSKHSFESIQDPDAIYDTLSQMLRSLLSEHPDVCGIGLCGQMHGILYIDAQGKAISKLYTWQDARAGLIYEGARTYCDDLSDRTGYPMAAGYGLSTHYYNLINALVPESAVSICTIADYIAMRLCGNARPLVHASNAASMGLFNIGSGKFDARALEKARIDQAILPTVLPGESIVGETRGIPVAVALGDNQASFMGSVDARGNMLVNIGTGSQLSILCHELPPDPSVEFRPYISGDYLMIGAGLCGGYSYELLKNFFSDVLSEFGLSSYDLYSKMNAWALSACGNENRLKIDTRFRGTRARPDIRGAIQNIRADNFTPGSLALGFLQGICDELYAFYEHASTLMATGDCIIGSGNAIRKNTVLRSLIAKTFQKRLLVPSHREEASCGAALLAAYLIRGKKSLDELRGFIHYENPQM